MGSLLNANGELHQQNIQGIVVLVVGVVLGWTKLKLNLGIITDKMVIVNLIIINIK